MPFQFTGDSHQTVAKRGVVSDGELWTTDGYGTTVISGQSSWSAFLSIPVRASTGVWSVTMKDSMVKVICFHVASVLPTGDYLDVQRNTITLDSSGRPVLHWTFNVAGTPTDLPASGQINVTFWYSETRMDAV